MQVITTGCLRKSSSHQDPATPLTAVTERLGPGGSYSSPPAHTVNTLRRRLPCSDPRGDLDPGLVHCLDSWRSITGAGPPMMNATAVGGHPALACCTTLPTPKLTN